MPIKRKLQDIINNQLFKGKAIVIYGARQVGKTTLLQELVKTRKERTLWLNGDDPVTYEQLKDAGVSKLKQVIGDATLVVIDEAQSLYNTGITLKLIIDHLKNVQLLVSGSSSFELTDKIKEALTGRKWEYTLYPLSIAEMHDHSGYIAEVSMLEHRLIFGMYPTVITEKAHKKTLMELSSDYLYKDLFALNDIRKPEEFNRLVQALAFQIGQLVSYNELAQTTGADKETVERYIRLLENAFIGFRLNPFSRNLRNELKKTRKFYFYDNGIRNAVIANFNPVNLRNDVGQLWENFLLSERKKFLHYSRIFPNTYFWRSHSKQEIDYLEEKNNSISAFEMKFNPKAKFRFPQKFVSTYMPHKTVVIHKENYLSFVT